MTAPLRQRGLTPDPRDSYYWQTQDTGPVVVHGCSGMRLRRCRPVGGTGAYGASLGCV